MLLALSNIVHYTGSTQVKVWFLESVTVFWEWLVPGHSASRHSLTQSGAFFHFQGLPKFRVFEIRKDSIRDRPLLCDNHNNSPKAYWSQH